MVTVPSEQAGCPIPEVVSFPELPRNFARTATGRPVTANLESGVIPHPCGESPTWPADATGASPAILRGTSADGPTKNSAEVRNFYRPPSVLSQNLA